MLGTVIELRHQLHRYPDLSGDEGGTATRVCEYLAQLAPDALIERLGGHGVACVFAGPAPGPTVMLRCELDALPILELSEHAHRSTTAGVAHQCGHDGHMAILAAVARRLSQQRPKNGRVVLLFQPAEETGAGAAAVIADPQFAQIQPDYCFALHNVPGYPLGQLLLRAGSFSCASRGLSIELLGSTAHAAQPETGTSPATAMCRIIDGLNALPPTLATARELTFATVVGARLGEKAFGTAPGNAAIWATLRTEQDAAMQRLIAHAEGLASRAAADNLLEVSIGYQDIFPATINAPDAVAMLQRASEGLSVRAIDQPFRWSEDFGHFTATCTGALFGIGSGENAADLHSQNYDFPDDLIPIGESVFLRLIKQCLPL